MKKLVSLLIPVLLVTALPVIGQVDCAECHNEDGEPAIRLSVFENSVHGDLSCTDCHVGADKNFDDHPDNLTTPDCSGCHEETVTALKGSVHSELSCVQCHVNIHELDPETSVVGNADAIMNMCARCHADISELAELGGKACPNLEKFKQKPPTHNIIDHYKHSAHYLKKTEDGKAAATCSDCHGSHDMLPQVDPASPIHKLRLSGTCGKCHQEIATEYDESVHGKAVLRGWDESPTCTCCHNSHLVRPTDSPEALTSKLKVAENICLSCHEDKRLIERYGLERYIGSTYRDSYHSMANAKGSQKAATCVDCHTTHHILRSSEDAASTNYQNVTNTCGQCHEVATAAFATSYDHKSALKTGNIINYYVKMAYIWLIILVIGGMFIHNVIHWIGCARRAWRRRAKEPMVQRMSRGLIVLHTVNLLSFFTLVVTGFALRFSDMPVVQLVLGWMTEDGRALTHRIAAVIMILIFLLHAIRIVLGRPDRPAFLNMLPRPKDIRDFKANLRYMLLLTDERPPFGKTTYAEKMEYLALMWGTVVMILTGLVLWFPELAVHFLPGWAVKVSETIHFYEAMLATMAIFFWHFYFVILNPDTYPLDFTFIDGKMPVEEIKHHRPEWYRELKEKGMVE